MLLIDAHLDLAMNALEWNRNLDLEVAEIRAAEAAMGVEHRQVGEADAGGLCRCDDAPRGLSRVVMGAAVGAVVQVVVLKLLLRVLELFMKGIYLYKI